MRRFPTIILCARSPPFWIYRGYTTNLRRTIRHPVLMLRMLIIGYVFGLPSERLLYREMQVNFAYRWFCKLGIEHKTPDHSVFSRARNEWFGVSGIFRRVFERVAVSYSYKGW